MEKQLEHVNHIIKIHNEVLYAIRTMRNCIHEYLPKIIAKTLKTDLNFMELENISNVSEVLGRSGKVIGYEVYLDRYWTDDSIWCHQVVDIKKKHLLKMESAIIPDIITYSKEIWDEKDDDILKARLLVKEYERMYNYLNSIYENECDRDDKEILQPHIIEVEELIRRESYNIKRRRRKLTNEVDN